MSATSGLGPGDPAAAGATDDSEAPPVPVSVVLDRLRAAAAAHDEDLPVRRQPAGADMRL